LQSQHKEIWISILAEGIPSPNGKKVDMSFLTVRFISILNNFKSGSEILDPFLIHQWQTGKTGQTSTSPAVIVIKARFSDWGIPNRSHPRLLKVKIVILNSINGHLHFRKFSTLNCRRFNTRNPPLFQSPILPKTFPLFPFLSPTLVVDSFWSHMRSFNRNYWSSRKHCILSSR
jgi:hypothetical protein